MNVLSALVRALRSAADVQTDDVPCPPVCVLWPDKERLWEAVVPRIQGEMPELFLLGGYAPEKRTGPALWLRCALAGQVAGVAWPENLTPVIYMPGFGRQDLRASESCPPEIRLLIEYRYRGKLWVQPHARDWTPMAFLKNASCGLGLDVPQNGETESALQLAMGRFLDEDPSTLRGRRLDKEYFNLLLMGGDPARDILLWLDQDEGFRANRSEGEWGAFASICLSHVAFDPRKGGVLKACELFAGRQGNWRAIWDRFCEAPHRYPSLPGRLRRCTMPPPQLPFDDAPDPISSHGGWPQWNEGEERDLGRDLRALADRPQAEIRDHLSRLEKKHGGRRDLVWAALGEAPLARALEPLLRLAERTKDRLAAGTCEDVRQGYIRSGWEADYAVLQALALVNDDPSTLGVVGAVIRALYLPWLEDAARHLQAVMRRTGYPAQEEVFSPPTPQKGECVLFVDGLRYDVARALASLLQDHSFDVVETTRWAPLPSVTATGKPAASPVASLLRGERDEKEFAPVVAATGRAPSAVWEKLLHEAGWALLAPQESGQGEGRAWSEYGPIDREGHQLGWKLAKRLDEGLRDIQRRIIRLFDAGWKSVRVVTDHGWLLLPGGLPKVTLASHLLESRWGRCAVIKEGTVVHGPVFPWFWNPEVSLALADGVGCFRQGKEYDHGGLSLQECLLPSLTVTRPREGRARTGAFAFDEVRWKGMRCRVRLSSGEGAGLRLDLRLFPGDGASSCVRNINEIDEDGKASVVVDGEDLEGQEATLVLLDATGTPVGQYKTVIGGGEG